jgi:hypothetical protein
LQSFRIASTRLPGGGPIEYLQLPLCAELARKALSAGFVREEISKAAQHITQVTGFVECQNHPRTQREACLAHVLKREARIELVRGCKGPRRTAD